MPREDDCFKAVFPTRTTGRKSVFSDYDYLSLNVGLATGGKSNYFLRKRRNGKGERGKPRREKAVEV